jgi:polysaccharide deacetylase 2 family uncharacterized protein YibQ
MGRDELRQPLRKRSLGERLWARRPSLLLSTAALCLVAAVAATVWAVRTPNPYAGEPIVTLVIPPPEQLKTASVTPVEEAAPAQEAESVQDPEDPHYKVVKRPDPPPPSIDEQLASDTYQTEATIQVSPRRPLHVAPDGDFVEVTAQGGLPRLGPGNRKVSDVYARSVPLGVIHSDQPKIAILLGGMGLNPKLTEKAIADLPGDVTFAFAPYGNNLQQQVNKARANGHEVMLQLPMEPMGYPANNPGPKTLLADASDQENLDALYWHMSRFSGYTGITNYMGTRLLSTPRALKPVLAELKRRGLIYLEDATTSLSASDDVGGQVRLPVRHAQVVIDLDPTAQSINTALDMLENEARTNGFAIGTGSGLEITTETVKEWADKLQDKGILLVPVSAVYKGRLG